jgi:hypothetical protein
MDRIINCALLDVVLKTIYNFDLKNLFVCLAAKIA